MSTDQTRENITQSPDKDQSTIDGEVVKEVHLKISPQYASINIVPKPDGEEHDKNFPHNLHNAAELFLRVGMVENAERLKTCADQMIDLYADNPDGKTGMRFGRACLCWNCGHCGLPKGHQHDGPSKNTTNTPPGPCFHCGETDQVNWVQVTQSQGGVTGKGRRKGKTQKIDEIPWIENAPLTGEELKKKKEAEMAAKRAEVEANVKRALAERIAAGAGVAGDGSSSSSQTDHR
jgi:hypothetical protein